MPLDREACPGREIVKALGTACGEGAIDCFAHPKPFVELRGHAHGADLSAQAASRARVFVDVARLAPYSNFEISQIIRLDGLDFGVRQKLDIGMGADLGHLRSENTRGAVEGGKHLSNCAM
jgi:hypothetical protein